MELMKKPIYFISYEGGKVNKKVYTRHNFYYDKEKPYFFLATEEGTTLKIRRKTFVLNMLGGNQFKYYAYLDYTPEDKHIIRFLKQVNLIANIKKQKSLEEYNKDKEYVKNIEKVIRGYYNV